LSRRRTGTKKAWVPAFAGMSGLLGEIRTKPLPLSGEIAYLPCLAKFQIDFARFVAP
jgi:hypothetical protein